MRPISFCDGWTYRRLEDDGPGTPVTIPHDAMLREPRTALSAGGVNTGWYEGHDYIYEKRFVPDDALAGQRLVLEFEGVYRDAEVYVNGEKLLFRPYGYTNFYVDVSDRLRFGAENTVAVIARNAAQPNSRWYSGAGLYRPVRLWTAPPAHIRLNGLRVRTVSTEPAVVEVAVTTEGAGPVELRILDGEKTVAAGTVYSDGDADGNADSAAILTLTIPDAKLWSTQSPNLYTLKAVFGEDESETAFGVRSLSWGPEGLLINGKRTILRGACIHHDNGVLGACCFEEAERRKIRLLKENGYNAIRSAHNPCSKALLRACDELGMLVMDEYIDHWYIHKTEYDYVTHFDEWWRRDLREMVEKDYNHPSVIMYSTGNEVSETAQPRGIALAGEMTEFLHALDPTRPVTCGVNIFFNFLSSVGFGVYSDEKAKKEAEKAAKKTARSKSASDTPQKKKAVGSEFFNNLAGLFGSEFMKRGATLPACDRRTRDAFANMDVAGYNYGIYRYEHDLRKYPERLIVGSETFCSDAYRFYELARREPRLLGDFVWAGMDYLGELGIGAWEYADYAPEFGHGVGWIAAGSGRIDLIGSVSGEAYYTRVALEQAPGPYIAVCPVNHTGDRHSPSAWRMSNAIPR